MPSAPSMLGLLWAGSLSLLQQTGKTFGAASEAASEIASEAASEAAAESALQILSLILAPSKV